GCDVVTVDVDVDVLQRVERPVVEIEVPRRDLDHLVARVERTRPAALFLVEDFSQVRHRFFPSLKKIRASTLIARTPSVIRNTPAQASFCQSAKGLMANLNMVTGRLAIGAPRSTDQNWLDSAVKRSGAVSPAIRATASSTPVSTPARAARSVT